MSHIPLIEDRESLDAEGQAAWDHVASSRGRIVGPYKALLHSPELAKRVADLGTFIRFESVLPGDVRELAIISTARVLDCRFEWAAHVVIARDEGVREEAIAAIRSQTGEGLTQQEAEIWAYANQLLAAHRSNPATVAALEARYGRKGLVELTSTMGYYSCIAATLNGFAVEPWDGADELPE
jgi:4-carboxymuconolactone decarboxylase